MGIIKDIAGDLRQERREDLSNPRYFDELSIMITPLGETKADSLENIPYSRVLFLLRERGQQTRTELGRLARMNALRLQEAIDWLSEAKYISVVGAKTPKV